MDEHRMNALKELMESIARHIKSRHVTMFGELGSNYLLDDSECDLLIEYWNMMNGDSNGKEGSTSDR